MKSARIALALVQLSVSAQWSLAAQNTPIIQTQTNNRDVIASVTTPSLTQAQMDIIVAMDEFNKIQLMCFELRN